MQINTNKLQNKTVYIALAILVLSIVAPLVLSTLNTHGVINISHQILSALMMIFGMVGAVSLLIGGAFTFINTKNK